MQDGPGIDVFVGFESWFPLADFVPTWKLLVHRLAADGPGRGFSADGSESFISESVVSSTNSTSGSSGSQQAHADHLPRPRTCQDNCDRH